MIRQGPFGRMATRLAALVADPSRCAVVVVTQAEEMPAQEALELQGTLADRLGRRADLLVVNGLYPPVAAGRPARADTPELALWRNRWLVNERELARLQSRWVGEMVELPLLPFDRGPYLVAELGRLLAAACGAGGAGETP